MSTKAPPTNGRTNLAERFVLLKIHPRAAARRAASKNASWRSSASQCERTNSSLNTVSIIMRELFNHRGFVWVVGCSGGQIGLPVSGSTVARTGAPVFGSAAVPMASATQRSADIFGRLCQRLEEVGRVAPPATGKGWTSAPAGGCVG
jgi:hypothetical protein